jgi:hypothetical protein
VPTWVDRVERVAVDVETVYNWPTSDAAAVLGVETAWLAGTLLALKFVVGGLYKEFVSNPRARRRARG